jgi:hypothetical protein
MHWIATEGKTREVAETADGGWEGAMELVAL